MQETGSVSGRVVDSTGQPVQRAAIEVTPGRPDAMGHVTAEDGSFRVPEVPAGSHKVVPMKNGVTLTEATAVDVRRGGTTRVELVVE